jgi:hypothetical protein
MTRELERTLTEDELRNLTQTLVLKESLPETATDHRPKVRYIAEKDTSVLEIMGAAVYALQQRGSQEKADELRRLILGGVCELPVDALGLIGKYVRMKIVDNQGQEIGSIG